ncbi:MAG: hypothetical protein ACI35S_06925 [Anaeroplasma sp.]
MGSFKRKLILSIFSAALTMVCLTSTTYAWFARNSEAWTDEFDFEIENYDGLLISIDGENYRSSIDNDLLKKAIVAKANNINILEDSKSNNSVLTNEYINTEFNKLRLKDVTTNNVVDFKTIDPYNGTNGYFNIVNANNYDYISFDLYFRVNPNKIADKSYDLTFVSNKYNETSDSNVPVSYIKAPDTLATIQSEFSVGDTTYHSLDKIAVNLKNAMRIGVVFDESIEANKNFEIYEPYMGYGSYAIKNNTNELYSPNSNIMLQYLNTYGKYDLEPLDDVIIDDKSIYTNTQKDFENEVSFAVFNPISDTAYNDVKITVAIWLEGYDSDYISTVDLTDLSFYLSFCKKERA